MTNFTESNTVEAYIRDRLAGPVRITRPNEIQGQVASFGKPRLGWNFASPMDVPRQPQEVMVERWVREALIRLNPEIAAQPDRSRVPVLLAIVYELMAAAPLARDIDAACPWRDVLRALGAAQTAAGCEITEAHETIAARIVAEVLT